MARSSRDARDALRALPGDPGGGALLLTTQSDLLAHGGTDERVSVVLALVVRRLPCAGRHVHGMTTSDPLIADLRTAIEKVACRIVERPGWLMDVSPTDRALVERVLQIAVLVLGGRKDVIH